MDKLTHSLKQDLENMDKDGKMEIVLLTTLSVQNVGRTWIVIK